MKASKFCETASRRTGGSAGLVGVCAMLACCGMACAQVLTPPPSEVKDPAKQYAPPPAPPQPINIQPANPQATQPRPSQPRAEMPKLPEGINYDVLVTKDASGAVQALSEPVHLAALRVNPLLDKGFVDGLGEYLAQRRATVTHLLVSNLDIVEQIDAGLFEQTDMKDKDSLSKLMNTLKPLTHPNGVRSLTEDLQARAQLDKTQGLVNSQIVRRYALASLPSVNNAENREQQGANAGNALLGLYKQSFEEYLFLLDESMTTLHSKGDSLFSAEMLAKSGLSEDALASVRGLLKTYAEAPRGGEARAKVRASLREQTTIEQRKALIEASLGAGPA